MNYAEQSLRARAHWGIAALFAAAGIACLACGLAFDGRFLSVRGAIVAVLSAAGAAYGLGYLTLYLRLSIERRKRYTWSIRTRLIVAAILFSLTVPVRAGERAWALWVLCLLVSLTAIVAVRAFVRRTHDAGDLRYALLPLLVADLLVVAAVASQHEATSVPLAAALTMAIVACLVASETAIQPLAVVLASFATGAVAIFASRGEPSIALVPFFAPAVFVAGGVLLARRVDAWHDENVERTIDDLTAFTLTSREEASELLVEATGILTRNWNDTRPTGERAVARWYEENSEYYLYDLAQFHLAYKHIAFMTDIASLAAGRVMDFGAGIGDLALELARRGHDTVYVDVEGRTKAFARWRAERDWIPVRFESSLEDVDGEFDTIISLDVFEHLAEPEPVIEDLVSRLAPGGRLIVTAAFGPTKAHPMHFDHTIDLAAMFRGLGLTNVKSIGVRATRGEFFRKPNVLVFERR